MQIAAYPKGYGIFELTSINATNVGGEKQNPSPLIRRNAFKDHAKLVLRIELTLL